jgi:cytoskeletal protein CcmA (bactofilin family)
MFNKKKQPPIRSLIAEGSQIQGHLRFTDGLRVDGEITGDVIAVEGQPSLLVISESALVTGTVKADHIIVNGRVRGPLHAQVLLELQPKARIEGDLAYAALEMHQGALVSGVLRPDGAAEEKPTLKLAANNQ